MRLSTHFALPATILLVLLLSIPSIISATSSNQPHNLRALLLNLNPFTLPTTHTESNQTLSGVVVSRVESGARTAEFGGFREVVAAISASGDAVTGVDSGRSVAVDEKVAVTATTSAPSSTTSPTGGAHKKSAQIGAPLAGIAAIVVAVALL